MTVDLRHFDPSPDKTGSGPPTKKGRPIWPYILGILIATGLYFGLKASDETRDRFSDFNEMADDPLDSRGVEGITFTRDKQDHYFRTNDEVGDILVITGLVRNSYPERRSFIRLRGHLLTADGRTLADRYAYAGNVISEKDLRELPIREIHSRLSLRGGRDGQNVDIKPGREIPFMLVFDQLPKDMAEYRVDPVGSEPSDPDGEPARPLEPGELVTVPEDETGRPLPDQADASSDELIQPDFFTLPDDQSEYRIDPAGSSQADED